MNFSELPAVGTEVARLLPGLGYSVAVVAEVNQKKQWFRCPVRWASAEFPEIYGYWYTLDGEQINEETGKLVRRITWRNSDAGRIYPLTDEIRTIMRVQNKQKALENLAQYMARGHDEVKLDAALKALIPMLSPYDKARCRGYLSLIEESLGFSFRIGYRYTKSNAGKHNGDVVYLCEECNDLYKGDHERNCRLMLESELWSGDDWTDSRICEHCSLTLLASHERATQAEQLPQEGGS